MIDERQKVLIVCTNTQHRSTLTQMFEDSPEAVTLVSSEEEALERLESGSFHLLILDTHLADLKEIEPTYGKLWQKARRIPAVIFTAFPEEEGVPAEHRAANAIFRLLKSKIADLGAGAEGDGRIMHLLRDRELQLREMRHRMKNNLQTIASLLSIQSSYARDQVCIPVIQEMQSRIKSIALVYEALYELENLDEVDFGAYLKGIVLNIFRAFSVDRDRIRLNMNVQNIVLERDTAMHCGLILNELATNSIKYAFRDGRSGEVTISLQALSDGNVELIVADNGVGVPANFDFRTEGNMGLLVVNALAEQIHGSLSMDSTNGTAFTLRFPQKHSS